MNNLQPPKVLSMEVYSVAQKEAEQNEQATKETLQCNATNALYRYPELSIFYLE